MDSDISKVQNILGKDLHIRNYFASTPGWFDSLLPKIDQCIEDERIPEISWYPKDAEGIGIDSYDLFFKIYERQIRMGAEQLKERNVPILFRPLYEMNGPYFGWQIHNSSHDTVEFWRRLSDIYHDIDNVKFVFSPNVMANSIEDYFPGEKYLDFIALDIYPNALIDYLGLGPEDLIGPELVTLHKLAPQKPFIVGEIGSDNPEWIYNALMHIITHMPRLAAIVPYNWDKWNLLKDNEKIRMYQRLFNDNCFSQSSEAILSLINNA